MIASERSLFILALLLRAFLMLFTKIIYFASKLLYSTNYCGWHYFIKKETLTQVLSDEFCKISKNTFFFTEYLRWLLSITCHKLLFIVIGYILKLLKHSKMPLKRIYFNFDSLDQVIWSLGSFLKRFLF